MIKKNLFSSLKIMSCFLVGSLASCNPGSQCTDIRNCQFMYDLLINQPSAYLVQFILSLRCGDTTKGVFKVCCSPLLNNTNLVYKRQTSLPSTEVCGIQASGGNRIVGGKETELDEFPWMALIRYDKPNGWGFNCAGVLITSRHVLTAAHCVQSIGLPSDWKLSHVRLGEWNISSERDCIDGDCSTGVLDVEVEQRIAHEGYDMYSDDQQNDIAILKLTRDVPFNDFIRPICLPLTKNEQTMTYDGYDLTVAGWGATETGKMSEVKLKVNLPVVNVSACANVYNKASRKITERQICAGGNARVDTCSGDSGGPLMWVRASTQNWVAVGIVSYGPTTCGIQDWPGVYTRVSYYIDWIKRNIS